jgi:hypothetical protein
MTTLSKGKKALLIFSLESMGEKQLEAPTTPQPAAGYRAQIVKSQLNRKRMLQMRMFPRVKVAGKRTEKIQLGRAPAVRVIILTCQR